MIRAGLVLSFMHSSSSVSRPPSTPRVYDQRQQRLEAGQAHRDLGPVPVPHRLLLAREGAGVGRDHRDLAAAQPLPQPLDVLRLLDLGAAGEQMAVLALEHRVVQHEVLRAGLGEHRHAARLGRAHDVRRPRPWTCARCRAGRRSPRTTAPRAGSPRPRRSWAGSSDAAARRSAPSAPACDAARSARRAPAPTRRAPGAWCRTPASAPACRRARGRPTATPPTRRS